MGESNINLTGLLVKFRVVVAKNPFALGEKGKKRSEKKIGKAVGSSNLLAPPNWNAT